MTTWTVYRKKELKHNGIVQLLLMRKVKKEGYSDLYEFASMLSHNKNSLIIDGQRSWNIPEVDHDAETIELEI